MYQLLLFSFLPQLIAAKICICWVLAAGKLPRSSPLPLATSASSAAGEKQVNRLNRERHVVFDVERRRREKSWKDGNHYSEVSHIVSFCWTPSLPHARVWHLQTRTAARSSHQLTERPWERQRLEGDRVEQRDWPLIYLEKYITTYDFYISDIYSLNRLIVFKLMQSFTTDHQ